MGARDPILDDASLHEARRARALRFAIAGFSAVLLLTIVTSIHLSTLDVSFGSTLFGGRKIWRGQSAAFRVAAYDPRSLRLVGPITAHFVLRDARGDRTDTNATGQSFAEARLAVPRDIAERCELVVTVKTPEGDDRIVYPLEVSDSPAPPTGRVAPQTEVFAPDRRPTGPLDITLFPHGGHIVAGLDNMISARITREGRPVETSLHTDVLGIHAQSNDQGILHFPYAPVPQSDSLAFTIGEEGRETLTIPVTVEPSGLLLEVRPRGFARPGGDLKLTVRTLPFPDPIIHVDVWVGDTVVLATSRPVRNRHLELEIGLPTAARGWVRVEAYRNLGADTAVRSSQLLWTSDTPPAEAAREALTGLATLPGGDPVLATAAAADDATRVELTRMALTRFVPETTGLPALTSTLDARRTTVSERRSAARAGVHTLFVLTLVAGLGLALGWVIRHQIQVRRNMRQVIDEGLAAGEVIDTEGIERLARFSHLYDLFLALFTIAMIGYGVLTLLLRIRWE